MFKKIWTDPVWSKHLVKNQIESIFFDHWEKIK